MSTKALKILLSRIAKEGAEKAVKNTPLENAANSLKVNKSQYVKGINIPRVSGSSEMFINQPVRRTKSEIPLSKEDADMYRAYGKEYASKNLDKKGKGTLAGSMKINAMNPSGQVDEVGLKFGSNRNVKLRPDSVKNRQDANRLKMESEQTHGPNAYREGGGHHRGELSFFDALTEGLSQKQKIAFFKLVNTSQRWPSMSTGNVEANLMGAGGAITKKTHAIVHRLLEEAGLDPKKMDFRNASIKERSDFLDQAEPIIDKIDEFIYNERMAERFPDRFKTMIK